MRRLNNLFFLVSHLLIGICLAAAQSQKQRCYDTGNFTTNSTYGRNRDHILASFPLNVSANGGFFSASIGQHSDKVYALGLCRGDSTSDACYSCINSSMHNVIDMCPNQIEAISWGGDPPCIVRYSNHRIFGVLELEPSDAGYNSKDVQLNITQFDLVWESLIGSVVRKASMGSSRLKYATGEAYANTFQKIYALMQCTPDLSQKACETCLTQSASYYQSFGHGKQGGYVQKPNCWFRWDLYPFYVSNASTSVSLLSPPPASTSPSQPSTNATITTGDGGISTKTLIVILVPIVIFLAFVILAALVFLLLKKRKKIKQDVEISNDDTDQIETLQLDLDALRVATDNFSHVNKLGQGGFGSVYKGKLHDGQDIAVKRLSQNSGQGDQEFKNEVLLIAKLQHKNLVRLLGFCLEQGERILVYEFLPNSSLDHIIFEYAMNGHFSTKSDVYSFGVLVLEIISGQKISRQEESESLLSHAWRNWNAGTAMEIIDPILRDGTKSEMMRCIHLGLLCIQQNIAYRPSMSSVVLMLSSYSISLPAPSTPANLDMHSTSESGSTIYESDQSKHKTSQVSINEMSISELDPR
ncbi:hypothetical protein COLO4_25684 [Corchorus olitorius]|uniref:Protein kinase domain-containing protein n=1 Tax=Corchorus olitorius TaxID=93759 RepID=A0A1R3I0D4_9ROSI|nr:hypothetical protein COLO4_25684 [Corchorus olitorius]